MKPVDLEKKSVRISGKRQVTIPQKFYQVLGFAEEAEFILRGNELVLKPLKKNSDDFSEYLLEDLIAQGYSGNELLEKFKTEKQKLRPAVKNMLAEAKIAADGKGEYVTYEDIFAEVENE